MLGVVLGLTSALGFGSAPVFVRLGMQHVRSTTATAVSLVVGTAVTMSIAFSFHAGEIFALSGFAFVWFLLSAVINFPLGRLLNFTSVRLAGVARATPIVGSSPMFAAALAVTIGGESMSLPVLAGTISIIGGLALVLSQR